MSLDIWIHQWYHNRKVINISNHPPRVSRDVMYNITSVVNKKVLRTYKFKKLSLVLSVLTTETKSKLKKGTKIHRILIVAS